MCFCDSCWLVWHLSHGTACEVEQPIVFEDEPLAIVSPECVAVGFVQAAGGFFEAGGEETPLGSADIFGEPVAELAPSDRASLGPGPLYVDRNLREAGSCDLRVFDAEADRVVEGLCRACLVSGPASQRSECGRCEPCGSGKVHVCLPAVAKGEVQPVAEVLGDPVLLDPFELAELEAELSTVEMSIRETLAGVSGRRMKGTRALLQRAVDMRALLVTRR